MPNAEPSPNLQGAIAQAIAEGALERFWTTADLVALHQSHFAAYTINTLRTAPPNRSADAAGNVVGHCVGDPAKAPFIRFVQEDGPLLYCLREHFEAPVAAAPPAGPLEPIEPPADYATFLDRAAPLLDAATRLIEGGRLGGLAGWTAWLAAYKWRAKSPNWQQGVADRLTNRDAVLAMRRGERAPAEVYRQVVNQWGGIAQALGPEWDAPIGQTMDLLAAAPDAPRQAGACGRRIASVSKLYAALAPDLWVIYDSRVAAALAYLALAGGVAEAYRDWLVVMPAKGNAERLVEGFKVPVVPPKGQYEQAPAFQAFVLGSWFCRAVAARLNAAGTPLPEGAGTWEAYHVEMVLFMLGEDLRKLPPAGPTSLTATVPAAAEPEVVLSVGGEGFSMTLLGRQVGGDDWRFRLDRDEGTMAELMEGVLDEDDVLPLLRAESPWVEGWEPAVALLDRYKWTRFHPMQLHPAFAGRVLALVDARGGDEYGWWKRLARD